MASEKNLKTGDHVEWGTSQGTTSGKVTKKITGTARVKGHTAKASKEEPQFKVKTDKSGKEAIHKPEELQKKLISRKKAQKEHKKVENSTPPRINF